MLTFVDEQAKFVDDTSIGPVSVCFTLSVCFVIYLLLITFRCETSSIDQFSYSVIVINN